MEAVAGLEPSEGRSKLRWLSGGTVAFAALLLFYLLLSVKRNELKPLWFDELGTLNVASQPTLGQMFRVEPGDGSPPLQYFLVRASLHLLGTSEFALRLPALLFEFLAIGCAYLFVGRRAGATAGLIGAAVLAISRPGDYGVEARPYGILLGLTMLLLVLWQRAAEQQERRERRGGLLAGLALTIFAMTVTHSLGVFWAAFPLLAAEAYRWWRTGRLDKALLLAILLGLSGFAITLYSGHATQQVLVAAAGNRHPEVSLPSLHKLHEALREEGFFPVLTLLLVLGGLAGWAFRPKASHHEAAGQSRAAGQSGAVGRSEAGLRVAKQAPFPVRALAPAPEWAAVGALVLTTVPVYLFTLFVTHYFWPRYLMPGVVGSFLLLGMASGSFRRRWVAATVLIMGVALSIQARRQFVREQKVWPDGPPLPALVRESDPAQPVLIGSPVLFAQIWWYSPADTRPRVHYIADARRAVAGDDFIGDLTLIAMRDAGSSMARPDRLEDFLSRNAKFLFWKSPIDNGDWVEGYLRGQQYCFAPLRRSAQGETLFQVSAPAGGNETVSKAQF